MSSGHWSFGHSVIRSVESEWPTSEFRRPRYSNPFRSISLSSSQAVTRTPHTAYSVPQRFGLGAIMAFTTIFAVLLGILRMYDAPVGFYVFFGVMGCTVCGAQMINNSVPRLVSVLVGAACLPLTAISYAVIGEMRVTEAVVMAPCLAVPGAVVGYLIGTIAAGVFLLGDLLEKRVRGETISTATAVDAESAQVIPTYTPDSCTPYLGEAASQLTAKDNPMTSDETTRVKAIGPPTSVPVYNCLALVSPRGSDGLVHARAANLSDLRTSGASEREALQHLVGAFKIIVAQCLAEGREIPFLKDPHPPRSDEQQRFIAVHL